MVSNPSHIYPEASTNFCVTSLPVDLGDMLADSWGPEWGATLHLALGVQVGVIARDISVFMGDRYQAAKG